MCPNFPYVHAPNCENKIFFKEGILLKPDNDEPLELRKCKNCDFQISLKPMNPN